MKKIYLNRIISSFVNCLSALLKLSNIEKLMKIDFKLRKLIFFHFMIVFVLIVLQVLFSVSDSPLQCTALLSENHRMRQFAVKMLSC